MSPMESNKTVTKHNDLINASYSLPLNAQKLILACLSKCDPRKAVPKSISLTAAEYSEILAKKSNVRAELYRSAETLWNAEITIVSGNTRTRARWVQEEATKIKGDAKVTIVWSERVHKYIGHLDRTFASYKIRHIANINTAHALRLYELLMKFKKTKTLLITIEDFKFSLGIEHQYPEFRILNRAVIKPAIKELNLNSDIKVEYETIKKGRAASSISFTYVPNDQMQMDI